MNKLTNFFGLPLSLLFCAHILISTILFGYSGFNLFIYDRITNYNSLNFEGILAAAATLFLVIAFSLSILFIFVGIGAYVFTPKDKQGARREFAKKLLYRGLIGSAISILFFFCFLVLLGLFSGPTSPGLQIPQEEFDRVLN